MVAISLFLEIILARLSVYKKDFPCVVEIRISGSELFNMALVNVLKPEKPDSITNSAKAPMTTPKEAIIVIMFIVLLLLLANKYLLAMYKEKFNIRFKN